MKIINNLNQPVGYEGINLLPLEQKVVEKLDVTPSIQDAIDKGIISIQDKKIKNKKGE